MFFGLIVVKINISHTCDIIDFVTQSLKRKRDTSKISVEITPHVEEKNTKYFLGMFTLRPLYVVKM